MFSVSIIHHHAVFCPWRKQRKMSVVVIMYFDIHEVLDCLFVCFCLFNCTFSSMFMEMLLVGLCSKYLRWHKPGRDGREQIKGSV